MSPAERDQRADTGEQLPERIGLRDHAEAEIGVGGLRVGVGARAGGGQLGRRAAKPPPRMRRAVPLMVSVHSQTLPPWSKVPLGLAADG